MPIITTTEFRSLCKNVFDNIENISAKYKLAAFLAPDLLDFETLDGLKREFLQGELVTQLYREQKADGTWGPLFSRDYSVKAVFPTTAVAFGRCLYLGLKYDDRDILLSACEYLESFFDGSSRQPLYSKNERAIPWQLSEIAGMIEAVRPGCPLCDEIFEQWLFIAGRAFSDGVYSHERDKKAQQSVFGTREDRLIPIPLSLLLSRRDELPDGLEHAFLLHYGYDAAERGNFWDRSLNVMPEPFKEPKTRRYIHTLDYVQMFRGSEIYTERLLSCFLDNIGEDGFFDWGTQIKDPWGYFRNYSLTRSTPALRKLDCTMEILTCLEKYLHNLV